MQIIKKTSLLILLTFLASIAWAAPGDRVIYLKGALKENAPQKLSVIQLEDHFNLFSTQIYNPWDKKTARYTGIWMKELHRKFAKPESTEIIITAIDQYQITYPLNKCKSARILIATQENGEHIPVANKGPMRIIFPDYDASDAAYSDNLPMWMWMIKSIEFK